MLGSTVLHLFKTVYQFVLITTEVVISSSNLRQVLQSSEAASKHLDKLAEERRMQIDRGVEMGTVAAAVASSGFGQSTISYSNGASFFPVELHIGGIPIFGQTRKNGTLLCSASYEEVLNHRTNVPSRQGRQTFGKRGNTRLGLVCLVAHSLVSIPWWDTGMKAAQSQFGTMPCARTFTSGFVFHSCARFPSSFPTCWGFQRCVLAHHRLALSSLADGGSQWWIGVRRHGYWRARGCILHNFTRSPQKIIDNAFVCYILSFCNARWL